MKKIFLSAVIALALCSYGYAQDDDEYEEDEAPAKVTKKSSAYEDDEEEDEAPVAKKKEKKAKKGDSGFFGIGLDLTGAISNDPAINLAFRLNDKMILTAIFGLQHRGETTIKANGVEAGQEDDATILVVGADFDYILLNNYVPFSIGGEFLFASLPDDAFADEGNVGIQFGVLAGLHGEIVPNVVLTGKAGLVFEYQMGDVADGGGDVSRFDFGLGYRVNLTWFAF